MLPAPPESRVSPVWRAQCWGLRRVCPFGSYNESGTWKMCVLPTSSIHRQRIVPTCRFFFVDPAYPWIVSVCFLSSPTKSPRCVEMHLDALLSIPTMWESASIWIGRGVVSKEDGKANVVVNASCVRRVVPSRLPLFRAPFRFLLVDVLMRGVAGRCRSRKSIIASVVVSSAQCTVPIPLSIMLESSVVMENGCVGILGVWDAW